MQQVFALEPLPRDRSEVVSVVNIKKVPTIWAFFSHLAKDEDSVDTVDYLVRRIRENLIGEEIGWACSSISNKNIGVPTQLSRSINDMERRVNLYLGRMKDLLWTDLKKEMLCTLDEDREWLYMSEHTIMLNFKGFSQRRYRSHALVLIASDQSSYDYLMEMLAQDSNRELTTIEATPAYAGSIVAAEDLWSFVNYPSIFSTLTKAFLPTVISFVLLRALLSFSFTNEISGNKGIHLSWLLTNYFNETLITLDSFAKYIISPFPLEVAVSEMLLRSSEDGMKIASAVHSHIAQNTQAKVQTAQVKITVLAALFTALGAAAAAIPLIIVRIFN